MNDVKTTSIWRHLACWVITLTRVSPPFSTCTLSPLYSRLYWSPFISSPVVETSVGFPWSCSWVSPTLLFAFFLYCHLSCIRPSSIEIPPFHLLHLGPLSLLHRGMNIWQIGTNVEVVQVCGWLTCQQKKVNRLSRQRRKFLLGWRQFGSPFHSTIPSSSPMPVFVNEKLWHRDETQRSHLIFFLSLNYVKSLLQQMFEVTWKYWKLHLNIANVVPS